MYISGYMNKVLYMLQLLSVTIVYTCALKSHMNNYQGGGGGGGLNQSSEG